MADIELVVKIDTERYEAIKKHNGIPTVSDGVDAADAILNGTPLPKGHGRLIILSEDAVKREQMPMSFTLQTMNWINEVGLSNATVAIIDTESEDMK